MMKIWFKSISRSKRLEQALNPYLVLKIDRNIIFGERNSFSFEKCRCFSIFIWRLDISTAQKIIEKIWRKCHLFDTKMRAQSYMFAIIIIFFSYSYRLQQCSSALVFNCNRFTSRLIGQIVDCTLESNYSREFMERERMLIHILNIHKSTYVYNVPSVQIPNLPNESHTRKIFF